MTILNALPTDLGRLTRLLIFQRYAKFLKADLRKRSPENIF